MKGISKLLAFINKWYLQLLIGSIAVQIFMVFIIPNIMTGGYMLGFALLFIFFVIYTLIMTVLYIYSNIIKIVNLQLKKDEWKIYKPLKYDVNNKTNSSIDKLIKKAQEDEDLYE